MRPSRWRLLLSHALHVSSDVELADRTQRLSKEQYPGARALTPSAHKYRSIGATRWFVLTICRFESAACRAASVLGSSSRSGTDRLATRARITPIRPR